MYTYIANDLYVVFDICYSIQKLVSGSQVWYLGNGNVKRSLDIPFSVQNIELIISYSGYLRNNGLQWSEWSYISLQFVC